jgi:phage tail sheath gpL-like
MPSADIQFYQIPDNIRTPGAYFEFNTLLAQNSLPANAYPVLIVAQMTAAGSTVPGEPIQVFSSAQAAAYFGSGSVAHRMCKAALTANPAVILWCCGVMDAAAGNPLAATGTLTLTETPTTSGLLTLWINNEMIQVGISLTDTPTSIIANLEGALEQLGDLPVTYAVAAGVITFTAKNKGSVGNQINLNCQITANGLSSLGVTAAIAAMSGGAVDPETNLATALANSFAGTYGIYVIGTNNETDLQTLRAQVEGVSAYNQQRGARGYFATTGSMAAAATLAGEINDGRMVGVYLPGSWSACFEIAAAAAAVDASSTDPAMPLNTLPLNGINAPAVSCQLMQNEIEALLWEGVSPLIVNAQGIPAFLRAISTYTTNSSGIPDSSLLDTTTIKSLDYLRLAARTWYLLRFARAKNVAPGPTTSGTAAQIRSGLYSEVLLPLETLEILENVEANLPYLLVEQDLISPTQLDAKIPANVVPGLHVFAGRIDLLL